MFKVFRKIGKLFRFSKMVDGRSEMGIFPSSIIHLPDPKGIQPGLGGRGV
jgi:hypothetical protein